MNTLNVSEHFYSMQCEGNTTGYPAYFIRLMNCNLSCGASRDQVRRMKRGEEVHKPGDFIGDLQASGKSTWTCDTLPVWIKSDKLTFEDIVENWEKEGIKEWVEEGRVNIIWTGGEPTIKVTQNGIISFLEWYKEEYNPDVKFFNEIETNGTGMIYDYFMNELNQINCSVKLSNSGMEKERRIVPASLNRIMEHPNYWFKFVISNEKDMVRNPKGFYRTI